MKKIKILALDQATNTSGYSIFNNGVLLKHGVLQSDHAELNTLERIKQMTDEICLLIKRTKPDIVILENIQFQRNIATFKSLAQLQGAIMYHLNKLNICYWYIEPTKWKSYCKIKGNKRDEQKRNTQEFVKAKYNLQVTEDEADAIGIGTWAINNIKFKENK